MGDFLFLGLKLTDECYSGCSFCTHGKESGYLQFPVEKIYDKLQNFSSLSLSGGEPLLHPNVEDLIKNFSESSDRKKCVSIMTSGISPDAPADKISRFYDNLGRAAGYASKLYVQFIFSYSDGKNPDSRLEQFLKKYNEIRGNTGIVFNIITEENIKKKVKDFRKTVEPSKSEYCIKNKIKPVDFSVDENVELLKRVHCFYNEKSFFTELNGDLQLCTKPYSSKISYANLITDSFEAILAKRKLFVEKLDSLFAKKGNTCYNCMKEFKN